MYCKKCGAQIPDDANVCPKCGEKQAQVSKTVEAVTPEKPQKAPGQTVKLVIGIISIVLFLIITLQSCAAGVGNVLSKNGEVSGSAGMILALFMLISGIVAVAARKSKGAGIFCTVLYAVAGIIGIASAGSYKDLVIWSVLCFIFAVLCLVTSIIKPKQANT